MPYPLAAVRGGKVVGAGAAVDPNNPGTTDLISWWPLDEASGARADSHGSNDLTDNNTVGQAVGKVGNAADFVAANSEYLSRADNASLSAGDVDVSWGLWVYLDDKTAARTVLAKFLVTGNHREYWIQYNLDTDRFQFVVSSDGGSGTIVTLEADNLGSPSINTWYFIVAWHDAAGNTLNIQVNNGTVDSVAHTLGIYDGTASFVLGRIGDASANYHDGRLDEVFMYKKVLSADERTWLYNDGDGRSYSDLG